MDAFVKIKTQKKPTLYTLHKKEIDLLDKYVRDGENVMICGSHGTGKTFILESVLNNENSIEFTPGFKLRDEMKNSKLHVFVEDYRHDVIAQRQIIDYISEGGSYTKGSFVVCSTSVCMLPNFKLIIVPKRTPDQIATLRQNDKRALHMAEKCKGNIHNFFHYLDLSDDKDTFIEPKELAISILTKKGDFRDMDAMSEHGHIWGMIHENYPESNGVEINEIARGLSDADIHDNGIYHGMWDSMSYFIHAVVSTPKYYLGEKIDENIIRPGSFWTKFGNYKMRNQKYKKICLKTGGMKHEELSLLRQYAKNGDMEMYTHYDLTPQDFDVINHLAVGNKFKPREVSQIKKKIKEYQPKPT